MQKHAPPRLCANATYRRTLANIVKHDMRDKPKFYIGLILCSIGVTLILYFSLLKVLILIPISFFIVSIVIKSRILSGAINSLTILPFLVIFIGDTITTSGSIIVESRIRYQIIDIGQGDYIRNGIEYKRRNKRIFLQDTIKGIEWLYVDSSDFKKLWPEPPFTMKEKNYTIKARFQTHRLLNGNYSKAILLDYDSINESPMITK